MGRLILLFLISNFFVIQAASGSEAYSQSPNLNIIDTSAVFNNPSDPGFTWSLDQDEESWAYFNAQKNTSFNQITWYGTNADNRFALSFFEAACFSCSASWVQTDGTFTANLLPNLGAYDQSSITKEKLSNTLYSYSVKLNTPISIEQGKLYALSVVNNYTSQPFSWAGSDSGNGFHLHYIVGQSMFLKVPGNLAFSLTNTSVTPVPEPKSWLMLLIGLVLIASLSKFRFVPKTRK